MKRGGPHITPREASYLLRTPKLFYGFDNKVLRASKMSPQHAIVTPGSITNNINAKKGFVSTSHLTVALRLQFCKAPLKYLIGFTSLLLLVQHPLFHSSVTRQIYRQAYMYHRVHRLYKQGWPESSIYIIHCKNVITQKQYTFKTLTFTTVFYE